MADGASSDGQMKHVGGGMLENMWLWFEDYPFMAPSFCGKMLEVIAAAEERFPYIDLIMAARHNVNKDSHTLIFCLCAV